MPSSVWRCWGCHGSPPFLLCGPALPSPDVSHTSSVLSQAISVSDSKGQCPPGMWQLLPLPHFSVVLVPCPGKVVAPDGRPRSLAFTQDGPGHAQPLLLDTRFSKMVPSLELSCLLTDSLTAARSQSALAAPSAPGQPRLTADHPGLSA